MTNSRGFSVFVLSFCAAVFPAAAAQLKGVVLDPGQLPVVGAQVAAITPAGVFIQQATDDKGQFSFYVSPLYEEVQLRITAPGFATTTVPAGTPVIVLSLAAQSAGIRVSGSALDLATTETGSSTSVITSLELRERNEAQAVDLLRQLPGMVFAQSGPRGSVSSLFTRGGDSKYNLALINGIPVNSFYFGGLYDFSHISSDLLQEIQVARGPQSAVYGSYALGSVINFVTRSPENGPSFDFVAEAGKHQQNRFALSRSQMWRKWGFAGSGATFRGNGDVRNADYTNNSILLTAQHRWRSQSLFAFGDYSANDVGSPGPFGSNPVKLYGGLDLVSRNRNYSSVYGLHYQDDSTGRLRHEVFAGFSLNNSFYFSKFGASFNKDIRVTGEARETWAARRDLTFAAGFAWDREEMRNTFVTDGKSRFLLRRDNEGIYAEAHYVYKQRLFINAGARGEIYQVPFVPGNPGGFPPRPDYPARTETKVSPKLSAAWVLGQGTRLHASYGAGIRPPGGSDLAFTNNPALQPERVRSFDAGASQTFARGIASLDATFFRNRYEDLIVSLGGNLASLSRYATDNLNNASAQGLETSAGLRPVRWFHLAANYTWLESRVLSLNGGNGLAQRYYTVGQPLPRRPKHSGGIVGTFTYRRLDANVTAGVRGHSLDVEPNFGASAGFYNHPGYQNVGINLNYRVRGNLTAYVNLHNAFNQRYEEIYGYPAPLFNMVAGLKWSLARAR
jgi:outer membrane cobalamin receptor